MKGLALSEKAKRSKGIGEYKYTYLESAGLDSTYKYFIGIGYIFW